MNDLIHKIESELGEAILAIQQPRTDFQLAHFVVGQHDREPRRWHQCVLELSLKIHAIQSAAIDREIAEIEMKALAESEHPVDRLKAKKMALELVQHDRAVIGAAREAETLYAIYKSFGRTYTHEELMAAEAEYWQARLTRQAKHSLVATGRIGVGDLDSFEQIGQPVNLEFLKRLELETCQQLPETPSTPRLPNTDTTPAT